MSGIGESQPAPRIPVPHWGRAYLKILELILTSETVAAYPAAGRDPRTIASTGAVESRWTRAP
jgi:hypothetical protein